MIQGQPNDHTVTSQTVAIFKPRHENLPVGEMGIIGSYLGGVRRGGIYLLAGPPGSRKSGLALQVAVNLTLSQVNSLFLLTEESPERLRERALMMISDWSSHDLSALLNHICVEPTVPAMQHLPKYVCQELLRAGGKWRGNEISLVVIDSAQGHGLSAAATREYAGLIEAAHLLAGAGVTVLIVSHMTKGGEVAGPAALEHAVDVAMVLKPTATARALFVKKNRFGSANATDPLMLELDDVTLRLAPAKLRNSRVAVARTYGGEADGVADVQACVKLAPCGSRGKLTAPRMPRGEIQQLVRTVAQIMGGNVGDTGFSIDLRLPGRWSYMPSMGLAVAAALVGANLCQPPAADALFIGEVDLAGAVRPVEAELLNRLCGDVAAGLDLSEPRRVFCHPGTALAFYGIEQVRIHRCKQLEQMVYAIWPSLR